MTEYSGRGDPKRSMDLLWGAGDVAPSRGPKPALSLAAVVSAAIELADERGIGALSMRNVADRLGCSPMSLYTYVPGKAELLDVMLDTAYRELGTSDDAVGTHWRAALEASARDSWGFYQRHPWVLQISGARALLGPHEFDLYEAQLGVVDGLGLSGVEMMRVVAVVSGFVRGSAKAVSDARTAEQATGVSDDDWWNARAPLLEQLATDVWQQRYPTISRLDAEQAFDQLDRPDDTTPYMVQDALDTFDFGLQRLLDGVESFVDRRTADAVPDAD